MFALALAISSSPVDVMISILGFVAIIVIAIQVYKSASSTDRNPVGWTALALMIGIGIQFVLPVMIGVGYGLYLAATNSLDDIQYTNFGLMGVIGLVSTVLSIVGMWFVAKHVSKVKNDVEGEPVPPPPPSFSSGQ
jgi:hypothetical protein